MPLPFTCCATFTFNQGSANVWKPLIQSSHKFSNNAFSKQKFWLLGISDFFKRIDNRQNPDGELDLALESCVMCHS